MAPVKKQKDHESLKANEKLVNKTKNIDESVVSGQLQKKINKKQPQKDPKGVVFIKHLPHGFFEDQLKKYFEQFGIVTRVRLARSRRTGNSKGYAFVEFEYPEVAEVAAATMHNYLMFKQIVKAFYIPPEKQQFNYFRTSVKKIRNKSGKLVWVSGKTASIQQKIKKHNDWSEENYQKRTQKQLKKLKKMGEKYAHLGINIDELTLQPKIVTEKENKLQEKANLNEPKPQETASSSKVIKRKILTEDVCASKQQDAKKSKNKKVSIEDLLGSTIQEDSEDEDYIAMADNDSDDEESSDEETYGFAEDSDVQDDEQEYNENESTEETLPIVEKKSKKNFGKSLKSSNVERFDQILKRNPNTGSINKLKKKHSVVSKNKKALQITAAKDMAKPLSKVEEKLNRPWKSKKKSKLIKIK